MNISFGDPYEPPIYKTKNELDLVTLLDDVKKNDFNQFFEASQRIRQILSSLLREPENQGLRTIKMSNYEFSQKVVAAKGGIGLFLYVGFVIEGNDLIYRDEKLDELRFLEVERELMEIEKEWNIKRDLDVPKQEKIHKFQDLIIHFQTLAKKWWPHENLTRHSKYIHWPICVLYPKSIPANKPQPKDIDNIYAKMALYMAVDQEKWDKALELIKLGALHTVNDADGCDGLVMITEDERVVVGKGWSALQIAVARDAPFEVIEHLVSAGANPNIISDKGDHHTPLHYASQEGRVDVVKCLLSGGAFVDARRDDGATPLISAALDLQLGVILELIKAGADVNAQGPKKNGTSVIGHTLLNPKIVLNWHVLLTLLKHGAHVDHSTAAACRLKVFVSRSVMANLVTRYCCGDPSCEENCGGTLDEDGGRATLEFVKGGFCLDMQPPKWQSELPPQWTFSDK